MTYTDENEHRKQAQSCYFHDSRYRVKKKIDEGRYMLLVNPSWGIDQATKRSRDPPTQCWTVGGTFFGAECRQRLTGVVGEGSQDSA